MAIKQSRSARSIKQIKSSELDFQFMRTLSTMSEGGAAVGECLIVRDKTTDGLSFAQAWLDPGKQIEFRAEEATKNGNTQTVIERLKRAKNYYRSSLTNFSPLAYGLWTAVVPAWLMNANIGPKILNLLGTTKLLYANKNSVDLMLWFTQSKQLMTSIQFSRACNIIDIEHQIE